MATVSSQKAKKDLLIAEIVYYTIGGIALAIGLFCSICSFIITNPYKENFSSSWVLKAQKAIFTDAFKWENMNFSRCGMIFMAGAIVYFIIVFYIFIKKGDEVDKKEAMAKSRQRQVVYVAPTPADTVDLTNQTNPENKAN